MKTTIAFYLLVFFLITGFLFFSFFSRTSLRNIEILEEKIARLQKDVEKLEIQKAQDASLLGAYEDPEVKEEILARNHFTREGDVWARLEIPPLPFESVPRTPSLYPGPWTSTVFLLLFLGGLSAFYLRFALRERKALSKQ